MRNDLFESLCLGSSRLGSCDAAPMTQARCGGTGQGASGGEARPYLTEVCVRVLGINAIFHDPAAAVAVDGEIVVAAEEERFTRRKHGKRPVPFSAWELPEQAARWCLAGTGIGTDGIDAVAYSYDPSLVRPGQGGAAPGPGAGRQGLDAGRKRPDPCWEGQDTEAPDWEGLRTLYARRAPRFLASALPGLDPAKVVPVPHHVAHAASAGLAAPFGDCAVLVADGRGEAASHLAGSYRGGELTVLASQELPHSLGLMYAEVTQHLGFQRSSDEYKVLALASYGKPRFLGGLAQAVRATGGSSPSPSTGNPWQGAGSPGRNGRRTTPTWPPACRRAWRRCSPTWHAGCTSAPGSGTSPSPGEWRSTAWRTRSWPARGRLSTCGCSPPRATRARRSAARSNCPAAAASLSPRWATPAWAGAGRMPRSRRRCGPRPCRSPGQPISRTRSRTPLRATRSSHGSRAAPSSAPARSGIAPCWPIPGARAPSAG